MGSFTDSLSSSFNDLPDARQSRREAFRYANATLALDGLLVDPQQLARQEEIIQGNLTVNQAIALCVAQYSEVE